MHAARSSSRRVHFVDTACWPPRSHTFPLESYVGRTPATHLDSNCIAYGHTRFAGPFREFSQPASYLVRIALRTRDDLTLCCWTTRIWHGNQDSSPDTDALGFQSARTNPLIAVGRGGVPYERASESTTVPMASSAPPDQSQRSQDAFVSGRRSTTNSGRAGNVRIVRADSAVLLALAELADVPALTLTPSLTIGNELVV